MAIVGVVLLVIAALLKLVNPGPAAPSRFSPPDPAGPPTA